LPASHCLEVADDLHLKCCIKQLSAVCAFAKDAQNIIQEVDTVKLLMSLFAAALMVGSASAQGTNATTSPAQPQTSAPGQTQRQLPEPQAPPTQSTPAQTPTAQAPQGAPQPVRSGAPTRIAPGSVIPVSLTKTIDAKKAKTGDEIVAKVTQDMKTTSGDVLVPKDTKVMGHVTEAQPRNKEQKESQVGIAFDHAVMKDGNTMQMPMSIQAVIGEQNDQNSGGGGGGSAPSASAAPTSSPRAGMGGSAPAPTPSAGGNDMPSDPKAGKSSRPPITAQTQGVVGISNLTLTSTASNPAEGSVVSSDKNNVKLESGTMMLLRVNQ
jgi:hypothetical protein